MRQSSGPVFAATSDDRLVHLGNCHRPHGLRGGLSWQLFSGRGSCLRPGMIVTLRPLAGQCWAQNGRFEIASIRLGNKAICYLVGVCERIMAEALVPCAIYLERGAFPVLDSGFYLTDLPGLTVRNSAGEAVGEVLEVYGHPAHEVLVVRWGEGERDIPLVDAFVLDHNLAEGWIQLLEPQAVA